MTSATTSFQDFADVGHLIAEQGIGAQENIVERLVRLARRHRLSTTLCDLLADLTAPPVARERAYGMLTAQLAAESTRMAHARVIAA
jgi:hypothetical protein